MSRNFLTNSSLFSRQLILHLASESRPPHLALPTAPPDRGSRGWLPSHLLCVCQRDPALVLVPGQGTHFFTRWQEMAPRHAGPGDGPRRPGPALSQQGGRGAEHRVQAQGRKDAQGQESKSERREGGKRGSSLQVTGPLGLRLQ